MRKLRVLSFFTSATESIHNTANVDFGAQACTGRKARDKAGGGSSAKRLYPNPRLSNAFTSKFVSQRHTTRRRYFCIFQRTHHHSYSSRYYVISYYHTIDTTATTTVVVASHFHILAKCSQASNAINSQAKRRRQRISQTETAYSPR